VSNIIRGVGRLFTKTEQDVALQEFEAKLNRPRL
jgi:chaperonin cofactor prefoldin